MHRNDISRYTGISDMVNAVLGTKKLQGIVNYLDGQYNVLDTEGFGWADEMTNGFSFSQLEVTDSIAVLPDLVDKASRGTSLTTKGFSGQTQEIPRFSKNFVLDEVMLRQKFALYEELGGRASATVRDAIMNEMYSSIETLIKGGSNVLTHMRDQIVSTGVLDFGTGFFPTSNLKTLRYDFNINKMPENTAKKLWWKSDVHTVANEGEDSNPIQDFISIRRSDVMRIANPDGLFEINRDLWEDLQRHTKVLGVIGRATYPTASADEVVTLGGLMVVDQARFKSTFESMIGARISIRDTRSSFNVPDSITKKTVVRTKANFSPFNIAYRPYGKLGEIQSSRPMLMSATNADMVSYAFDGRMQFLVTTDERNRTQIVDNELTAIPVPERAGAMAIMTVTK